MQKVRERSLRHGLNFYLPLDDLRTQLRLGTILSATVGNTINKIKVKDFLKLHIYQMSLVNN